MPPTRYESGYAGDGIAVSLRPWVRQPKKGRAVGDNKAFRGNLPNRESFSPDAAYYSGPRAGPTAEGKLKEKRRDYFAAGTLIIWDVDLLSEDVVKVYRAGDPEHPTIYRRGEIAENACGRSVSVALVAPGRTRRER